jgi:hypothetical protein
MSHAYVKHGSRVAAILCVVVLLSACGGGGGGVNSTQSNPPPAPAGSVQFELSSLSVNEGVGIASLTVTRTGGSAGAVSVTVASSDGSATAGHDYTAINSNVSFADGDSVARTVAVPIINDDAEEPDETLNFRLSAPTGGASLGTNATVALTIRGNDAPPPPAGSLQFEFDRLTVNENTGSVDLAVTRTGGSVGGVSVAVTSSDGTATAGQDYERVITHPDFADGDTTAGIVTVRISDDSTIEPDETLSVTLSAPAGGATLGENPTVILTIRDDDTPPPRQGILQFEVTSLSIDESAGTANLTITRTGGSDGAVSVAVVSNDGSAAGGQDYTAINTRVSFAAGDTAPKTVTVAITDDIRGEEDETLSLTLVTPAGGAVIGANATATLTIRESDKPQLTVQSDIRQLLFSWTSVPAAISHHLLQSVDGGATFTQVGNDHGPNEVQAAMDIAVHRHDWARARYRLRACNPDGCSESASLSAADAMLDAIGYFKASNTQADDIFGNSIAMSADGNTLAVGSSAESSAATGVNGDQSDNTAQFAGAVYVFTRGATGHWSQQAYVKASNTGAGDGFGQSVALSTDGNTLAVGANGEDSAATGVNGDQSNESAPSSGAVYVFTRDQMGQWSQQAYVKASNTEQDDSFGQSLALSPHGNTLAVGAVVEASAATGVNGNQNDNTARFSGAVYVFTRNGLQQWSQQAYLKASNTQAEDFFGFRLGLSEDGNTLAVAATSEDSASTQINGDQNDNTAPTAGAVYVFIRNQAQQWSQQAYIKASNAEASDKFGEALALSADGNTLAVGAPFEDSAATGVDGEQTDNTAEGAGATYVFIRDQAQQWTQQAYVKASNTRQSNGFGEAIALSADGGTLAVGAPFETGRAAGVNGDEANPGGQSLGAVYVFTRSEVQQWSKQAYVKASNPEPNDTFGQSLALSADGGALAVSALNEDSNAVGIGGNQANNEAQRAGAVYLY